MDEEPQLIKKAATEIHDEIKKEFEREPEVKEQQTKELIEEQKTNDINHNENQGKKKSIGRIIFRIIWVIILLFVIFDTVMGILNMQRLNENKKPIFYFSSKKETIEKKEITTYHLGLYVIEKEVAGGETRVILKPFFLK